MSRSERVTTEHLTRKAVIYMRQSTPHQVLTHQESLRLQYALQQRARTLGWRPEDIDIIDADVGLSATAAQHREGFKELLTKVTPGQVGMILSYEVTRLSRHGSDWSPLLDICGYRRGVIADRDGVYDPATPNGRLLLGLKGQSSEMERHTIRARLTAGLLHKAQRGELALQLPVGLCRDAFQRVQKDPNLEVQHRIDWLFTTFLPRHSASHVLRFFHEHELTIPRRDVHGDLVWKQPTVSAILATLQNPASAGAFVYGRTTQVRQAASPHTTSQNRLPIPEWNIRVPDTSPAYISWETFEKIQAMLQDNYAEYDRNKTRGIPRAGAALLHGIVSCGECGHTRLVQYKRATRHLCNHLRPQYGVPVCQYIPADPIDASVVEAFFQALSPIELDAYARAMAEQHQARRQVDHAHALERLRYQAALAQRQCSRVDPDNRLVAAELEHRWEAALRELQQAEAAYVQQQQTPVVPLALTPELKAAFTNIGHKLPQLWNTQTLSPPQTKALLRCLIDTVVIHRATRDHVHTRIVWKGGDTTTVQIPLSVGSLAELSSTEEMEQHILQLSGEGTSDREMAKHLSNLGYRSPMRLSVLPSTVQSIRFKHRLFQKRSQSHPRSIPGYLTVPQLAQALDISRHWVYDRMHNGCIHITKDAHTGLYLFPDTPASRELFTQLTAGTLHNLRFS